MRTPSTDDLISLAETAGIAVTWHRGGPQGAWIPPENRISIRHGMDDAQTRCALAHELAHMWLGHPAPATDRQEMQADRMAAELLISTVEYALVEQIYGPQLHRIAKELNVTTDTVRIWRDNHERRRSWAGK